MAAQTTLLVLGGKPIGSCEIVEYAKSRGARVIVADWLDPEQSPAKLLADESWNVSTADLDELEKRSRNAGVNAVLTGVHEFNIEKSLELCARLGLPSWCSLGQWRSCCDKGQFKALCLKHGIDVARRFDASDIESIPEDCYPLAVKPLDGSGSRGFSKCSNVDDVKRALSEAKEYSLTGQVLIEEFIDANAVIIQYTARSGRIVYSGITDKFSLKAGDTGAPVMALQIAPSIHEAEYLNNVNEKAKKMFESIGISDGPIWIEAFYKNGRFIFNEMGLRFGGSMTNLLVEALSGIDQMSVLYDAAVGLQDGKIEPKPKSDCLYAIWPVHLRPGKIKSISGMDKVSALPSFAACTMVHGVGDLIEDWGSAQQVLAYLHFRDSSISGLMSGMKRVKELLSVKDEGGNELLYSLFDPNSTSSYPDFLVSQLDSCEG